LISFPFLAIILGNILAGLVHWLLTGKMAAIKYQQTMVKWSVESKSCALHLATIG
jgi:hypothetical protein